MVRGVFKVFEYRDFRLMWSSALTSTIGTWMQKGAQAWLVWEISKSEWILGLDAFLGEIPIFLFSLLGGVAADRYDRRFLLIASQLVQMTSAFSLALLFSFGVLAPGGQTVWPILALSFLTGLGQAFGGPAYQALLPSIVRPENVQNAIAWNSIQFNISRVIGPVLGIWALESLGAQWCFSLNGVSFVAVIGSLLMVRPLFVPSKSADSVLDSLKQGVAFIRGREGMVPLIVLAFTMTTLGIPLLTFLPVITQKVLGQGLHTYKHLLVVTGVGSALGALLLAGLSHLKKKGRIALSLLIVLGGLVTGFALSTSLWMSYVLLFFASATLLSVFIFVASLVQTITTNEMRGRVMSIYNVAFRGGNPFGSLLSGFLIPVFSIQHVLVLNGILLSVTGAYFLFIQRRIARL
ncbi:MAG: MFS transporter [Acidobacteria bacterium]|nr:MFS transporter [Acidobacteriota bacterium]